MSTIRGTAGYGRAIERFVTVSQSLAFEEMCRDFLPFLPQRPGRILDAGSGAGQNAAAMAGLGHVVVAAEPMAAFRAAARQAYPDANVVWQDDSLPELASVDGPFDFILVDGVWHHLSDDERCRALARFQTFLAPGGHCALSLRNGPAGLGACVFPTSASATAQEAAAVGFTEVFRIEDQASILSGKPDVRWSRLVLQRPAG